MGVKSFNTNNNDDISASDLFSGMDYSLAHHSQVSVHAWINIGSPCIGGSAFNSFMRRAGNRGHTFSF